MATRKNKKKKPNTSHQQDERTRMNVFYRNLKEILTYFNCGNIVDIMDMQLKKAIFKIHLYPPKLYPEDAKGISKKMFKEIQYEINRIMHEVSVPLPDCNTELPAYKFYTYLGTMSSTLDFLENSKLKHEQQIAQILSEHINITELERELVKKIFNSCNLLSFRLSKPPGDMICVYPGVRNGNIQLDIFKHKGPLKFLVTHHKQVVKMLNIDNHPRPVFRLGILNYNNQQFWSRVNRSLLENVPFDAGETVPVYLQSHAMERLKERLDMFDIGDLHFHTIYSFIEPKIIRSNGYYLIEYEILNCKLGYWVARFIEGDLVILTFLFLTNHSTPEGAKLEKLSGLSKIDIQYWNIDRISTFYQSDLKDNAEIRKLFNDAGCESLFHLQKFAELINFNNYKLANRLIAYIQPPSAPNLSSIAG